MALLLSNMIIILIIIIITYRKENGALKTSTDKDTQFKEAISFKRKLNHDLNGKEIWMVDYENVCRLPDVVKEDA